MASRDMDVGPHLVPTTNLREPHQKRHGRLVLEMALFNWNVQGRYVKLLIFETKAYELSKEVKVPVIKNWLGQDDLQLIKCSQMKRKINVKHQKEFFGP